VCHEVSKVNPSVETNCNCHTCRFDPSRKLRQEEERIQELGETAEPKAKAKGSARVTKGASAKGKATKKTG
jgi:hypothetical protein